MIVLNLILNHLRHLDKVKDTFISLEKAVITSLGEDHENHDVF